MIWVTTLLVKAPKHAMEKYEYIIMAGSDADLKAQRVKCGEILSQPAAFVVMLCFSFTRTVVLGNV